MNRKERRQIQRLLSNPKRLKNILANEDASEQNKSEEETKAEVSNYRCCYFCKNPGGTLYKAELPNEGKSRAERRRKNEVYVHKECAKDFMYEIAKDSLKRVGLTIPEHTRKGE